MSPKFILLFHANPNEPSLACCNYFSVRSHFIPTIYKLFGDSFCLRIAPKNITEEFLATIVTDLYLLNLCAFSWTAT